MAWTDPLWKLQAFRMHAIAEATAAGEVVCQVCLVPDWMNPIEDHREWTGHDWSP